MFTDSRTTTASIRALTAYGRAVLSDNPIGYWPLAEQSGSIAYDRSGNNRHGQYISDEAGTATPGGTPMVANAGGAAVFNGGQVSIPNLPIPSSPGSSITVSFVMWVPATGGLSAMPFTLTTPDGWNTLWLWHNRFGFNTGNADDVDMYGASNEGILGQTVHVAAVFTNATTLAEYHAGRKLYINGVPQTLTQTGTPLLKPLPTIATISGTYGYTKIYRLTGGARISDLAIFLGELPQATIQKRYQAAGLHP